MITIATAAPTGLSDAGASAAIQMNTVIPGASRADRRVAPEREVMAHAAITHTASTASRITPGRGATGGLLRRREQPGVEPMRRASSVRPVGDPAAVVDGMSTHTRSRQGRRRSHPS